MASLFVHQTNAQSPHGEGLKIDCASCHNSTEWKTVKDSLLFSHTETSFPLEGAHTSLTCESCHVSLIFAEASSQCRSCHTDIHSMSLGDDCKRCHTPESWLVDYIPELHEEIGFPLAGAHFALNCVDCHVSETDLRFNRIGNDCINCHLQDFSNTTNPNHENAGFSTNCVECHDPFDKDWSTIDFAHDIFPLVSGHDINDCKRCHLTNNFSDASPLCSSCHIDNYNNTTSPNHAAATLSLNCQECHSIISWSPPIFNHSIYPFVGAHLSIANDCNQCHNGIYNNTPNTCVGCHLQDYNNTTNPNHIAAQFSTDCIVCHNESAWTPASYLHNSYVIMGAHTTIANDCNQCHSGGFINTPNTCVGCHLDNFNNSSNPNHINAQFPTDCIVCHNENVWVPSTFDHDGMYFPIYSGKHDNEWNQCTDCHMNSSNYAFFSCINCHEHNDQASVNNDHNGVSGYVYTSAGCFYCHPDGRK